jgi:hypothetical protein
VFAEPNWGPKRRHGRAEKAPATTSISAAAQEEQGQEEDGEMEVEQASPASKKAKA